MFNRNALVLMLLCAAGCKDATADNKEQPSVTPPATTIVAPVPSPIVTAEPVKKVELEIASVGDTMTFDKAELTVPAKAEVHLLFKNNAKLDALPHNWVLVHEKTEARVAADGLALGVAGGYLPQSDDVLASVPLTLPGKSSEITFTAPKYVGKYPYICTVPGHYVMMKGVLIVTP